MRRYNIRVVSTFPNRDCGIGEFAKNKLTGTRNYTSETGSIDVAAIHDGGKQSYDSRVDIKIDQYDSESWTRAGKDIATRALEKSVGGKVPTIVDLQLEYGLAGRDWQKDNNYIFLLDSLRDTEAYKQGLLVVIGTKHTVLGRPDDFHREADKGIVEKCDATVVMSELGKKIMASYGVVDDVGRVEVIGHGARMYNYTLEDKIDIKNSWGIESNVFTFVTPGLISPNKGIFSTIVPAYGLMANELSRSHPHIFTRKLILGECHPDFTWVREDGIKPVHRPGFLKFAESANRSLEESGYKLNNGNPILDPEVLKTVMHRSASEKHGVVFQYGFLSDKKYSEAMAGADVVDLLNQNKEQVTSGQLVEAVSHGCDIIAGKFWHAVGMLSDFNQGRNLKETLDSNKMWREGEIVYAPRGVLVDIGNVEQVAEAMYNCVVGKDAHAERKSNNEVYGKDMGYDKKHGKYLELADDILNRRLASA